MKISQANSHFMPHPLFWQLQVELDLGRFCGRALQKVCKESAKNRARKSRRWVEISDDAEPLGAIALLIAVAVVFIAGSLPSRKAKELARTEQEKYFKGYSGRA